MKAPTRIILFVFVIIGVAGLVVALGFLACFAPPKLVVSCSRAGATATFNLSNSAGKFVFGWCEAPQVHSNGNWRTWAASPNPRRDFCLRPGGATNLTVPLPHAGGDVRIPFAWGFDKSSAMQRVAPRLHTRFSNLQATLRNSRSVYGWGDPYGYLPDERGFYYVTNAEQNGLSR
jgi:hypothetical protein